MKLTKVDKYIVYIILIILISFLLGWLFPVEGPLDWVYDDMVYPKKCPSRAAPPIKKEPVKIDFEDFDFQREFEEFYYGYRGY